MGDKVSFCVLSGTLAAGRGDERIEVRAGEVGMSAHQLSALNMRDVQSAKTVASVFCFVFQLRAMRYFPPS
jgi:hypothetical protein